MPFITRLRISSLYKVLVNNIFLLVIAIIFLVISISYNYFIIVYISYISYLFYKSKRLFFICVTFCLFYIFLFVCFINYYNYLDNNEIILIKGTIISIEPKENSNKIIIIKNLKKYIFYDKDYNNFEIGEVIQISGKVNEVHSLRIENGFNYLRYLLSERVVCIVNVNEIENTSNYNYVYFLKNNIYKYINSKYDEDVKKFLYSLLFANSIYLDDEFKNEIATNGLSHLFAVSGLHISYFLNILNNIYTKLKINKSVSKYITYGFLLFYAVITGFTPSIMRVTLAFCFKEASDKYYLKLTSVDCQSLSFIVLILINPFIIFNLGFILSFLVSFTILLIYPILNKKNELLQILLISIGSMVTTLPFIVNINYSINILSPITNVIFILLMSYIILPQTITCLVVPIFQKLYYYTIIFFEKTNSFFSKYFKMMFDIKHMSLLNCIIYYSLFFLLIKWYYNQKNKYIILSTIISFLILISSFNVTSLKQEIHFLDLDNGESTVIIDSYSNKVVLIDTGDGKQQTVTNFLKSMGIKKIDAAFITHNHEDHNGEIILINNEFIINKIYINEYDNNGYSKYPNVVRLKANDLITIGQLSFEILSPYSQSLDENDNSLVILANLFNKRFLFMGDASINIEKSLKNIEFIDIIKIGHHGSKTSTSNDFIAKLKPRVAIIQTGRVEKFNFPNQSVIAILEKNNVEIYRTDLDYSIIFKKNGIIKTYSRNTRIAKLFAH